MKYLRSACLILWTCFISLNFVKTQDIKAELTSEHTRCLNDQYHRELESSYNLRRSALEKHARSRSNNGNFEVHFYIDTSYERRRVGAYNKNNEVISYMKALATNLVRKLSAVEPNWDGNYKRMIR